MKRILLSIAAAAALSSPLHAQLTSVNGANACFTNISGGATADDGVACSNGSDATRWSMPGSYNSSDDQFYFERAGTPGAPGAPSTSLSFGANNLSNVFNLGFFQFQNESIGDQNRTATLRFQLFLNAVTATPAITYDQLTVNYFDQGNNPETFNFSGGGWSSLFNVGSEQYRFAVVGFDTPHPGAPANYCQSYDAIPSTRQYTEANNGKLCGQFERVPGTTVPEPSTYALMAAGLAGLGFVSRRRRTAA